MNAAVLEALCPCLAHDSRTLIHSARWLVPMDTVIALSKTKRSLLLTYKVLALTSWVIHIWNIHPAFPTLLVTSPCSFQSENMSLFTTRFTLPCLEWWLLVIWTYWIHFPKFICFFFIWKYTFSNGNTFPFVKMSWLGFMKHQMRKVIKTEGRSSLLPGRVDKDAKPEWYIWLQASGGVTRVCEVQRPCWDWSGKTTFMQHRSLR